MNGFLLLSILSASLFYLGSRAQITSFLWSRYPHIFARFMDCPACVGFWWGFLGSLTVGAWCRLTYLGLDLIKPYAAVLVGLCSVVVTPVIAGLMQRGLDSAGSAVPTEDPDADLNKVRLV